MGKRDGAKILLPSSQEKSSSGKCTATPYKSAKKKAQPTFSPRPALWRPNSRPRGKNCSFFPFPFFPDPGDGSQGRRGWKREDVGEGGGGEKPLWGKIKEFMARQKGEGERETSVAEKEAGAAFIITGLDTTFSREGKGRDLTAFPTPFVARTNFSPPSEFSSLLSPPLFLRARRRGRRFICVEEKGEEGRCSMGDWGEGGPKVYWKRVIVAAAKVGEFKVFHRSGIPGKRGCFSVGCGWDTQVVKSGVGGRPEQAFPPLSIAVPFLHRRDPFLPSHSYFLLDVCNFKENFSVIRWSFRCLKYVPCDERGPCRNIFFRKAVRKHYGQAFSSLLLKARLRSFPLHPTTTSQSSLFPRRQAR